LRLSVAALRTEGATAAAAGEVKLFTTGQPSALQAAAQRWLQLNGDAAQLHF